MYIFKTHQMKQMIRYLIHFHPPSISIGKHFILDYTCRLHLIKIHRRILKKSEKFRGTLYVTSYNKLHEQCCCSCYMTDYMRPVCVQIATTDIFLNPRDIQILELSGREREVGEWLNWEGYPIIEISIRFRNDYL